MSVSQISNAESERVKFGLLPFTRVVTVQGKLGSFDVRLVDGLNCELSEGMTHDESKISLNIDSLKYHAMNKYERKFLKSMHGTTNSILSRYVEGVSEGHQVTLQLVGVGYKVALDGTGPNAAAINLRVGYSHPVIMPVPAGIQVKVPIPTKLVLIGADYHQLTQFAANIRSKRPPEPYNGKGIFVDNEKIVRKEGKKSK